MKFVKIKRCKPPKGFELFKKTRFLYNVYIHDQTGSQFAGMIVKPHSFPVSMFWTCAGDMNEQWLTALELRMIVDKMEKLDKKER